MRFVGHEEILKEIDGRWATSVRYRYVVRRVGKSPDLFYEEHFLWLTALGQREGPSQIGSCSSSGQSPCALGQPIRDLRQGGIVAGRSNDTQASSLNSLARLPSDMFVNLLVTHFVKLGPAVRQLRCSSRSRCISALICNRSFTPA
jgi:hypothetical protein